MFNILKKAERYAFKRALILPEGARGSHDQVHVVEIFILLLIATKRAIALVAVSVGSDSEPGVVWQPRKRRSQCGESHTKDCALRHG